MWQWLLGRFGSILITGVGAAPILSLQGMLFGFSGVAIAVPLLTTLKVEVQEAYIKDFWESNPRNSCSLGVQAVNQRSIG